jgi:hypothetical protein
MFTQLTIPEDQPFIISEMKGYPSELDLFKVQCIDQRRNWSRRNIVQMSHSLCDCASGTSQMQAHHRYIAKKVGECLNLKTEEFPTTVMVTRVHFE